MYPRVGNPPFGDREGGGVSSQTPPLSVAGSLRPSAQGKGWEEQPAGPAPPIPQDTACQGNS